ncbi:PTP4A [Acanthosepion pharaonis]|uniref:protein-tyrosine-phosphatase n=1 Tax=Acanthosepion pharaonis TaxID=158019 RepID=A0A812CVF6_ACAPH|nr:PTP4A [Sepia pharaonis]
MCRNILDLLGGIVKKTDSPSTLAWPHHLWRLVKFFGEFGHTFMEFVTNSGDFCQAQHVFLIMDRPTDGTLDKFIEELKTRGAKDVVRVCEPTYPTEKLHAEGIRVYDWKFDDGSHPPMDVIDDWLNLLKARFRDDPGCCVAVHCVAGLGRAPVLVALALTECGMKYEDAVELIRNKRRGAINAKQLQCLLAAQSTFSLLHRDGHLQATLPTPFSTPTTTPHEMSCSASREKSF